MLEQQDVCLSIPRLILGFMVVTAFLSMWISNTATTAMMIPIMHAVLQQLHSHNSDVEEGNDNPTFELQEPRPQKETKLDEKGEAVPCLHLLLLGGGSEKPSVPRGEVSLVLREAGGAGINLAWFAWISWFSDAKT